MNETPEDQVDSTPDFPDFADFVAEERKQEPRLKDGFPVDLLHRFEIRLADSLREAKKIFTDLNKTADPPGMRSAVSSPLGDERDPANRTASINDSCCQSPSSKKIVKWGVTLTDAPPSYWINKKVAASRRELNPNERHCLGLLNALMKNRFGNTFVTTEQLAHWLGFKNTESVDRVLRRLIKKGIIKERDKVIRYENEHRLIEHRIVVCKPWRDPKKIENSEPDLPT
jgi:hypothetical protein